MFTGIVKGMGSVLEIKEHASEFKIRVEKPKGDEFFGLKTGDSVAVNGVCLTLEEISSDMIQFHLGHETLKITKWNKEKLQNQKVNLEPALKMGDFIGGHFISGHVDGMAEVTKCISKGESLLTEVKVPSEFKSYFWKKAFVALNGVSLTVNEIRENQIRVCLIPETLHRTNLLKQEPGNLLTFEVDHWARALVSTLENIKV